MRTVAITGATGFVGSKLAKSLARAGYETVLFGRRQNVNVMHWDITSGPREGVPKVDAVVHCAAHVDDWSQYEEAYRVNVVGTNNVLETFPHVERFIFISSASVYDPFTGERELNEDSQCGNFLNAYSRTKREAELAIFQAHHKSRVILRPHIIYGPGDTTVLPRLLDARRFGYFLVVSNGMNVVSVTHIENVCVGVQRALESNIPDGYAVFNIADRQQDSVDAIMNELRRTFSITEPILHIPRIPAYALGAAGESVFRVLNMKHPPLLTRYAVAQMAYGHALDISKARKVLGYEPLWNYQTGFADMKLY